MREYYCNTQSKSKASRKIFAQLRTSFVIWIDKDSIKSIRLLTLRVRAATLGPYNNFDWIIRSTSSLNAHLIKSFTISKYAKSWQLLLSTFNKSLITIYLRLFSTSSRNLKLINFNIKRKLTTLRHMLMLRLKSCTIFVIDLYCLIRITRRFFVYIVTTIYSTIHVSNFRINVVNLSSSSDA